MSSRLRLLGTLVTLLTSLTAPAIAHAQVENAASAALQARGSGTSGGGNPKIPVVQGWIKERIGGIELLSPEDKARALHSVDSTAAYCKDEKELGKIAKKLSKLDRRYYNGDSGNFAINSDATEIYSLCYPGAWNDYQPITFGEGSVESPLYFYLRTSGMSESQANDVITRLHESDQQRDFARSIDSYKRYVAHLIASLKSLDAVVLPEGFDVAKFQSAADKLRIVDGIGRHSYGCGNNEKDFDKLYACADYQRDGGLHINYDFKEKALGVLPGLGQWNFETTEATIYWILRNDGVEPESAFTIAARLQGLTHPEHPFNYMEYDESVDTSGPSIDSVKAAALQEIGKRLVDRAQKVFAQDPSQMPSWTQKDIDQLVNAVNGENIRIVHTPEELSGCESGVVACSDYGNPTPGARTRVLIDKVHVEGVPALVYHEVAVLAGIEPDGHYASSTEMTKAVMTEPEENWRRWFEDFYASELESKNLCAGGRSPQRIAQLSQLDSDFNTLVQSGGLSLESHLRHGDLDFEHVTCHVEVSVSEKQDPHSQFMLWSTARGFESWVSYWKAAEPLGFLGFFFPTTSDNYPEKVKKVDVTGFADGFALLAPGVIEGPHLGREAEMCGNGGCLTHAFGILKFPKATP